MLRCISAVVLDYWKQEMAVTGDETESGRVSLIHLFVCCAKVFFFSLLPVFSEICIYAFHMLSAMFSTELSVSNVTPANKKIEKIICGICR